MTKISREQFSTWLDGESTRVYFENIRQQVRVYRLMADQPQISDSDRLWFLAKAQGLEEAELLTEQWLKQSG